MRMHTYTHTHMHLLVFFTPLPQQRDTYGHIRHTCNVLDSISPSVHTLPHISLIKYAHIIVLSFTMIKSYINFQVLNVPAKFFELTLGTDIAGGIFRP